MSDFLMGVIIGGVAFSAIATLITWKRAVAWADGRWQDILAKQNLEAQSLQTKIESQFESVANKILIEKVTRMQDQNSQGLSQLLEPLKERIKDFEKKVHDTYSSERTEMGILKGELNKLMQLNQQMSSEAANLSNALRGNVKTQGNWGELILEKILERSGLRKDSEYVLQGQGLGLKSEDGGSLKPDVIVYLPEGKHLIVDSKVSLVAFEKYIAAEKIEDQDLWGRKHLESIKEHIKGLSSKKYYDSDKLISPDFVILFMPLEPAFALAFKLDPELLQFAWDKNIALVSPTTLLTTLRTVAALWKQDLQEKNALEIAKRGGALYDKFYNFIKDLETVGKYIESAQKSHQEAISKLSEGPGNLVRQVDQLRELGAKTEKRLAIKDDQLLS
jgi:DNA recombination protein RmuC